ncbi:MAG: hypothetical protein MK212_06850 [Saprospiraceae bacterium]|nr:hypothetical protein [Saprospiraceae bacterium]
MNKVSHPQIEHLVGYWNIYQSKNEEPIAKIDLRADGDLIYLINGELCRGRWFWKSNEKNTYFVLAFRRNGQEIEEQWFCKNMTDLQITLTYQEKTWIWKKVVNSKVVSLKKIQGTWVCFEIDGQHIKYTSRVHKLNIDNQRIAIYQGGKAKAASSIAYGSGYITLDHRMVWEVLYNSQHLLKIKQHSGQICLYTKSKPLPAYQKIHQLEEWKGIWISLENPQQQILIGEQQQVIIKEKNLVGTYKGEFDTTGYFLNIKQTDYSLFLNEEHKEILTVYSKSGAPAQYFQQVQVLHPLELSIKLLGTWRLSSRGILVDVATTLNQQPIKWETNKTPIELHFLPNFQLEYWNKWEDTVSKEVWDGESLKLNLDGKTWEYYNYTNQDLIFKQVNQRAFLVFRKIGAQKELSAYQLESFTGHWVREDGEHQILLGSNGKFRSNKHQDLLKEQEWKLDQSNQLLILGDESRRWGIHAILPKSMIVIDLEKGEQLVFDKAVTVTKYEEQYEYLKGTWKSKYSTGSTYELILREDKICTFLTPQGEQEGQWKLLPSLKLRLSIVDISLNIQLKDETELLVEYNNELLQFCKQTQTRHTVKDEVIEKLCGHWYFTQFCIEEQPTEDVCLYLDANQSAEICINGNYKKATWTVQEEDRHVLEIIADNNIHERWKINMLTAQKAQFSTRRYGLLECERLNILNREERNKRISYLLGEWQQIQAGERLIFDAPGSKILTFNREELIIEKQNHSERNTYTWRLSSDGGYIIVNEEYTMFIMVASNGYLTVIQGANVENFVTQKSIGKEALEEIKQTCIGRWHPMTIDPRIEAPLIIGEHKMQLSPMDERPLFPYHIHPSGHYLIMETGEDSSEWMSISPIQQNHNIFATTTPTLQVYAKGKITEEPIIFRKKTVDHPRRKEDIQGVWQITKQLFIDAEPLGQLMGHHLDMQQQRGKLLDMLNFKYARPDLKIRFVWNEDGTCQIIDVAGQTKEQGQWILSADGQTILIIESEEVIDILDLNSTDCIIKISNKVYYLERLDSPADIHQFRSLNRADLIGSWSYYATRSYKDPNIIVGEQKYTLEDDVIHFNQDGTFLKTRRGKEMDIGTWSATPHFGYLEIFSLDDNYDDQIFWLLEQDEDKICFVCDDQVFYFYRTLAKNKYESLQAFLYGKWKYQYYIDLKQYLVFKKGGKLELIGENQQNSGTWHLHQHGQVLTLVVGDDKDINVYQLEINETTQELILTIPKGMAGHLKKQ